MPTYDVISKATGESVFRYNNDSPVDLADYPADLFDQVAEPDPVADPVVVASVYGGRRVLTRLEFLRLMTSAERVTLRTVAKTNPILEDYMALMDASQEMNLDDEDTINGVRMLEQSGLLATGRAGEILNG